MCPTFTGVPSFNLNVETSYFPIAPGDWRSQIGVCGGMFWAFVLMKRRFPSSPYRHVPSLFGSASAFSQGYGHHCLIFFLRLFFFLFVFTPPGVFIFKLLSVHRCFGHGGPRLSKKTAPPQGIGRRTPCFDIQGIVRLGSCDYLRGSNLGLSSAARDRDSLRPNRIRKLVGARKRCKTCLVIPKFQSNDRLA